jgi:hypothetical protein
LLRKIQDLASKTRQIPDLIDSTLRVRIRVERVRLTSLIKSIKLINPDAVKSLDNYSKELIPLERKLSLIQQINILFETFSSIKNQTDNAPPILLDEVDIKLEKAIKLLDTSTPGDKEFLEIESLIQEVYKTLENINDTNTALAENLAKRTKILNDIFDENTGVIGSLDKCKELRPKLKDLFDIFQNPDLQDKSKILQSHYHWQSSSIERLQLLRFYIQAWSNATVEQRENILELEVEFLDSLRSRKYYSLQRARRLRYLVDEKVNREDIREAISSSELSIFMTPNCPFPNEPAKLKIHFNDQKLNTSKALSEFNCEWHFNENVGNEEGWEISHYFRNEKETEFTVKFRDQDGKIINSKNSEDEFMLEQKPFKLRSSPKTRMSERGNLESIKLLITLVIVMFGLIAGAKEELMKLDIIGALIAIFLLGYGADTVKSLVTNRVS